MIRPRDGVLYHYRFDPERGERRNVVVAAYDDEAEFHSQLARYAAAVTAEIAAGTRSPRENVSGGEKEAGYQAAHARGRNVGRAIAHGASPRAIMNSGSLPSNMAVISFSADDPDPPTHE